MKRIFCLVLVLCLILPALAAGEAEPAGGMIGGESPNLSEPVDAESLEDEDTDCQEYPWVDGALFDTGVQKLTCAPWGSQADFAYVGGWIINIGYYEGDYHITGWTPDRTERVVLAIENANGFVPADGAIVHYGMDDRGTYGWLVSAPGDAAAGPATGETGTSYPEDAGYGWTDTRLPLHVTDTVFYADDEYIWYYTYSKAGKPAIGRVGRDGKGKKKLGTVNGHVVTMLPGYEVLLADFTKNRVRLWRSGNGAYETIYSPKEDILLVASSGKSVWVQHEGWYGPILDGEVTFRLPGRIVRAAGSTDQFVALVLPREDAAFFDVMMFNETYRAYAPVGRIPRSESTRIELQEKQMIIWGPEESLIFRYPIPELWLPYGYHEFFLAENRLDDAAWMEVLVGSWCAVPDVGAGYAQRLVFTKDELYRLPAQEGKTKKKAVQSLWYVLDGRLLDYVDRDSPRRLWLSGPFSVPEPEAPYPTKIMIDGIAYYKYSNDPKYFDDLKAYGITIQ